MGLPEGITYQDERYPFIVLAPIGKKNKQIRSIGHKFERGLLSRLNDTIMGQITLKNMDVSVIRSYLNIQGPAVLPVAFQKEETVHPYLLRPEFFLWNTLSEEHGLPLKDSIQYEVDFTQLSAEQLHKHVGDVLEDYLFLAEISKHTRGYWLSKIYDAFQRHPLVQLYHKKTPVIDAVETMNQSSLLSVLKYPEDVAYWRHRVDIVMRPFRSLPEKWLRPGHVKSCGHEKSLHFDSYHRTIHCQCEECDFCMFYHVEEDCVSFVEEFDVERSRKRLITIEQQFNSIAQQNEKLLEQLGQLRGLKKQLAPARKTLDESLQVAQLISRYQQADGRFGEYPLLDMYDKLRETHIPARQSTSELIWLSSIRMDDIQVFKKLPHWLQHVPENVYPMTSHVLEELNSKLDEVRYEDSDVIITIKGRAMTYVDVQQVLDLVYYYGSDYPVHTLVQILAGKATNKLRTLKLHETRWFGLLSDWPEKYIQKLFNQLEKQGWIMKQQKGYSISEFADEVM
ncbi:hypothetical protein LCL89_14995 [Halobacillus yeomjeoni]|uniref:RQC-minor-2 family DNA-binding protein n=1 Tax=Halobacillus yeomjeoni TaxID=311194 RepID=UPI001CD46060|nr:RQC-minor-2 family DNA-binding protein [Halobacillus yeomjeoni]MCA0985339.1 hypothetical protein [Halobacillus yeomjeoni]